MGSVNLITLYLNLVLNRKLEKKTVKMSEAKQLRLPATTVYVCSYTEFDNLAHVPRGEISSVGITICELDETSLKMVKTVGNIPNPAYMTRKGDYFYVCSESILQNDRIYVYCINKSDKSLDLVQDVSSEGLSACYLHIDETNNKLLCINYWDSVISVFSIDEKDGKLKLLSKTDGNGIKLTRAMHLKDRHSECHTHSIEINKNSGLLYVCDLGDDVMKVFKEIDGKVVEVKQFKTGSFDSDYSFHGPRYTAFSNCGNFAYVVNEISNSVCALKVLENGDLSIIQTISSLPEDFDPKKLKSTCGGINLHPSGKFVSVSNRGHDSISTFKINQSDGSLQKPIITQTTGKTPRHFKFNESGNVMLVPNQDTNNVSVFSFNPETGDMDLESVLEGINSPNYVFM